MHASDFIHCRKTHDLLMEILFTETGLHQYPPAHPANQYLGVVCAFEGIRDHLVNDTWESEPLTGAEGIEVTRRADMKLFLDLYQKLNAQQALGVDDEQVLISTVVYPVIACMVRQREDIRDRLASDLEAYARIHGEAVERRIRKTMEDMGIRLERKDDMLAPH